MQSPFGGSAWSTAVRASIHTLEFWRALRPHSLGAIAFLNNVNLIERALTLVRASARLPEFLKCATAHLKNSGTHSPTH